MFETNFQNMACRYPKIKFDFHHILMHSKKNKHRMHSSFIRSSSFQSHQNPTVAPSAFDFNDNERDGCGNLSGFRHFLNLIYLFFFVFFIISIIISSFQIVQLKSCWQTLRKYLFILLSNILVILADMTGRIFCKK